MESKKHMVAVWVMIMSIFIMRVDAQENKLKGLFDDLRAKSSSGASGTDEADPVLEEIPHADKESVVRELPTVLQAVRDPHILVRRIGAMALWEISTRGDGQALLSGETSTLSMLLVDPDIPIRRVSMLAVATLRPNADTPIVPFLRTYLSREDAVSTIGAFVATVLMETAPNDVDSMNAVVRFMHRSDQTLDSQEALLNAIRYRARSHNRDIAKEVALYTDSPSEQLSVRAIQTLEGMGKIAVSDNQQLLSRVAGDASRPSSVRTAAAKALSAVQSSKSD